MTETLWIIVAYTLQLTALIGVAAAATSLMRIQAPRYFLRFWQVVMAIALLVPLAQPRAVESSRVALLADSNPLAVMTRAAASTHVDRGLDAAAIVLLIIAFGAVARLAWLSLGLIRLNSIVRDAIKDESFASITNDLSAALGVRAEVRISDRIQGPATVGVRRPIVLLPPSVREMSAAVQRAILCHEFTHVRRRDWVQTIAEELWRTLLWFHPLAQLLASRLSLGREIVVDEATILMTRDRRAYAEALLAFSDPQPHVIGVTPFIGRRTLGRRVALIADETPVSRDRAVPRLAIAVLALLAMTAVTIERLPMFVLLAQTIYEPRDGISLPTVVRKVAPSYTREAMQQGIEGSVWMKVVVGETGDVTDVQISKSLDAEYGLDNEAVTAMKRWKFRPGMRGDKAVAVRITIEMTFTLK